MPFNDFKSLELKGISSLNEELGHGVYGRVYAVKYCELICAAKEIHSVLFEGMGEAEMHQTIKSFQKECHQCSSLHHPNIVQFLGIYHPPEVDDASRRMQLPVMVMEMMAESLTVFVVKYEKIATDTKFSIVHDVSLGLCYLHNHHPPIVHRDLSPNNVLLTAHHVAKISDLGVAKIIEADSRKTMTKTVDFMPPEALDKSPVYGPPMDMFSFGGIILHTFNQQWPSPSSQVQFYSSNKEIVRRWEYLEKMIGEAEVLKSLVEECLDDDPDLRPSAEHVCHLIGEYKKAYMNTEEVVQSKFIHDAPPLLPTLTSGKYYLKWKRLADFPAAVNNAHLALQDRKVYVSGCNSPNGHAEHQVFVYEIDNDRWGQLPTPDHYCTIPHIIGGKLTLIGGYMSGTDKVTNKVSTFDQTKQSWMSYYPNLLSGRSLPGVVTHMEYVIVAGGEIHDDVSNDIEILDWVENSQWKRISVRLPMPMYALQLTIFSDDLIIVGYANAGFDRHVYNVPVSYLIATSSGLPQFAFTKWVKLTKTIHKGSYLVRGLFPLTVVGGLNKKHEPIADVMMYDRSTENWKKIGSLSFARSRVGVAAINDNAIIIIGGCTTKHQFFNDIMSSSVPVVELGQVEEI